VDEERDQKVPVPCPSPGAAFDPPHPPGSTAQTAGIMAAGVAGFGAFLVVDALTGGVLHEVLHVARFPDFGSPDRPEPVDVASLLAAMPSLAETAPPRLTSDHNVLCTRCSSAVPYSTMALNEHGYFCAPCAASMP
jgi:hypothetical protein